MDLIYAPKTLQLIDLDAQKLKNRLLPQMQAPTEVDLGSMFLPCRYPFALQDFLPNPLIQAPRYAPISHIRLLGFLELKGG